jgi:hypothetical protein
VDGRSAPSLTEVAAGAGLAANSAKFFAPDGRPGRVWSESAPEKLGMRYYGMGKRPAPPSTRIQSQTKEEDRDTKIELDRESILKGTVWGLVGIIAAGVGAVVLPASS